MKLNGGSAMFGMTGPRLPKILILAASIAAALMLAGCGQDMKVQPTEPTASTACSLDGMLLLDFPGPKGQIVYDQGPPDFFCDTVELLAIYLRPEQKKRVVAVYTQDMGKADWTRPQGHWIDARSAYDVIGSKRTGSMGPTIGSFAAEQDAQAFAAQYGGKALRFDQITFDMVSLDGGVLKN